MTQKTKNIATIASSFIAFIFFASSVASADPTIGSFQISPSSSLWTGESPTFQVTCTEGSGGLNMSSVVVQTVRDDGIYLANATLSLSSGVYQGTLSSPYFASSGNFTSTAVCVNNAGAQHTLNATFTVSAMSMEIVRMNPSPLIFTDSIEIYFLMKRDGANITSGPNFTVKINGNVTPVINPNYDSSKGWVSFLSAFSNPATYNYLIIGEYNRGRANASLNITVNNPISTGVSLNTTIPNVAQNISSTYTNWRNETPVTNMSIRVYVWNGSGLVDRAYYQDSNFQCSPGCSRTFSANYVANETGFFFAKTTVPFNSTLTHEFWTAWIVFPNTTVDVPEEVRIKGPQGEDFIFANNLTKATFANARMETSFVLPELYSEDGNIVIAQDDSTIFEVNVNNVGNAVLERLKMHLSVPSPLEVEANPKVIQSIVTQDEPVGASNSSFLVSVRAPQNTPPGEYTVYFKIIADETSTEGRITVEVLPREALSVDDIRQRLASYGIIVQNLRDQIEETGSRGVDVSAQREMIAQISADLDSARSLFNRGRMTETRLMLAKIMEGLESTSLSLASADIYTFRLPEIPVDIVAEASAAVVAVAAYLYWRKRSRRRPRLLKGLEQEKES